MLVTHVLIASFLFVAFEGPVTTCQPEAATRGQLAERLPNSIRITRTPDLAALTPSSQRYTVQCTVRGKKEGEMTFSTPVIVLKDGEKVTISDTSTERFVIAEKAEAGTKTPICRDVVEGSTFEIAVLGVGDGKVMLDVTGHFSSTDGTGPGEAAKPVRVSAIESRMIQCATLGEKIVTPIGFYKDGVGFYKDGGYLEAIVDAKND